MPTCDYCDETFTDEAAHLEHLASAHADELGRIDRRRVAQHSGDDSGIPTAWLAVGVVVVLGLVVGGGYLLFGGGAGGSGGPEFQGTTTEAAPTPHDVGEVHYHGQLMMVVDGQEIDFSQRQYQLQANPFHFENGDGQRWHGHARGVTLGYAMETLDIGVTADSVTYRGTTYTDGENARVRVTVNGEPVTPRTYVLQEGDEVRVVVESA